MKVCEICEKDHTNRSAVCSTCSGNIQRWKKKIFLVQSNGSCCKECNNDDIRCLDFHHVDSKSKDFAITDRINHLSLERLLLETRKCILLCANCHRKHHASDKQKIIEYCKKDFIKIADKKVYKFREHTRKIDRPSKEKLSEEVWIFTLKELSEKYNASQSSIVKWCKYYNISKPSRGYWSRKRSELNIKCL